MANTLKIVFIAILFNMIFLSMVNITHTNTTANGLMTAMKNQYGYILGNNDSVQNQITEIKQGGINEQGETKDSGWDWILNPIANAYGTLTNVMESALNVLLFMALGFALIVGSVVIVPLTTIQILNTSTNPILFMINLIIVIIMTLINWNLVMEFVRIYVFRKWQ